MDYGNPHDEIEGIWIDAAKVGNETRYMNDAMGMLFCILFSLSQALAIPQTHSLRELGWEDACM